MRQGSKPTIRDVAATAGVSLTTVSYVLSGRPGGTTRISPSTQERVHAAVRELGFVANRAARGMRRGRTDLVAIAVVDLEDGRDRALATAVAQILPRHGYQSVILLAGGWRQFMLSGGADGLILGLRGEDDGDVQALAELAGRGVAQIVISDTLQPAGFDVLAPGPGFADSPAAALASAETLAERAVALLLDRLKGKTPAGAGSQPTAT
ncbi:LacI family DNA-binding transcriptional regulator [Pseudarthrobacter sp. H2]|uniref:LacI family DNA-binding transcriptional regulator n=1 Tax=Pseudarthrobacter sp. H2 TaxID=3418415 RepID=UPI003CF47B29